MRRRILAATALALLVGVLSSATALAISKDEIVTLAKLGVSADEIIKAIKKDRTIFNLEIAEILELKGAGVPQEVIAFMMNTPRTFGAEEQLPTGPTETTNPNGTTNPTETTQPTVVEKTPEEIRAEAERARLEAQRQAEIRDKQLGEARRIQAQQALRASMLLAEQGDYLKAIPAFQKFLEQGNYAPESEEAYAANYGMGLALAKAGFWKSAGDILVDIVLQGPDRAYFQPAFDLLREGRTHLELSYPTLEGLTRFFVGNLDKPFQDRFNYFLGEFFFENRNYSLALKYFDQVADNAPDYASSQYLKGVIQVRSKMYKSAVESFQMAIMAQERNMSDAAVADLGFMALARIAATLGDYDAAIYYFRKVPKDSLQTATALYESAWSYFKKGDFTRALGSLHALHSPYFGHYFYPELWIMEATIYLNMCHYDLAKEGLTMFKEKITTLQVPLEDFLRSMRTPSEFYLALQGILQGQGNYNLPVQLLFPVLSNVEFHNMYRTIKQIEMEKAKLESETGILGRFAEEKVAVLEAERASQMNAMGVLIQELLEREVRVALKEFGIRATEVEVDLDQVEMEKLEMETALLLNKEKLDRAVEALIADTQRGKTEEAMLADVEANPVYKEFKRIQLDALDAGNVPGKVIDAVERVSGVGRDTGGNRAIVGSDSLEWPFEGEYWLDEVWSYRSFLKEGCLK